MQSVRQVFERIQLSKIIFRILRTFDVAEGSAAYYFAR